MPGSVSRAHLDETTLLRLVVSDLSLDERQLAERHVRRCAICRPVLKASERLDGMLRKTGQRLADLAEPSQALPEGDPFARRPAADHRSAADFGLDVLELARDVAQAVPEAHDVAHRILAAISDNEQRQMALNSLDLDSLRDRLALAYALDGLLDRVEEAASLRSREAGVVLERLDGEEIGPATRADSRAAAEYTMPLADLRGRAFLLSGAAALWIGHLDEARNNLLSAWRAFGEGSRSELLLSRVEVFEALRRIGEERYPDAAALASRAATAFSVSAHEIDAARATLASGLAEWGAGQLGKAVTLLRRSSLDFGRAEAWSGFATAACAAALCLVAGGRIEDSRSAFRVLRRRKIRKAPLAERMFVRETERIALLSARMPSKGKRATAAFSAADAVLLRGASVLAEDLVAAARESDEKLEIALATLHGCPSRRFALFYACQKGSLLVVQDPLRALVLARGVVEEVNTVNDAGIETRLARPAPCETVRAEAKLLESQAQVQLGYAVESRMAAAEARERFRSGGDMGFGLALADYFEGQAAGFARDYVAGERLLNKALKAFAEFGQDNLMGRAEAALGTLIMQRGDDNLALPYYEHAIEVLDPKDDGNQLIATLNNWAQTLMRLKRFDEARASYARALTLARKLGARASIQSIRNGLAELDFRRGHYDRALRAFSELARVARAAHWKMEQLFAELYIAECLGRLGRERQMAETIIAVRAERKSNPFSPSPAMEELFDCLDRGTLDADVIAHVRTYLGDEAKGSKHPSWRLKVVG